MATDVPVPSPHGGLPVHPRASKGFRSGLDQFGLDQSGLDQAPPAAPVGTFTSIPT